MAMDIHLYLTTRKDSLPDLGTFKHVDEVHSWFKKVDNIAVHHDHFSEINEGLLKEAKTHSIIEAYAVIFYSLGELFDADEVGEQLHVLFKKHRVKFSWSVTPNEKLKSKFYDVYLEILVGKGDDAAEEAAKEKSDKRRMSLEEREKMLLAGVTRDETEKIIYGGSHMGQEES